MDNFEVFGNFVHFLGLKNDKVCATGFQKNICMSNFSHGILMTVNNTT